MEEHEIKAVIINFNKHRKKRESMIVEQDQPLDNLFEETVTGDGTLTVKSTHTAVPVEEDPISDLITGMMELVKDEHTPVIDSTCSSHIWGESHDNERWICVNCECSPLNDEAKRVCPAAPIATIQEG